MMDEREIELAKQRLLSKVVKTDSCWLWGGALTSHGYGSIKFLQRRWGTHRLSYTVFKGSIPDGLMVCHSCDVRACVNPDHLWLGTNLDNQRDSESKGRAHWQNCHPSQMPRTHCFRGHDYSVVGFYAKVRSSGRLKRSCKECNRIDARNYRIRKSAILAGKKARRSGSDGAMDSATDF
ncbi:MAG: HNH endonuclease signature motif containing protein [Ilumatobacteraceae bacterium]